MLYDANTLNNAGRVLFSKNKPVQLKLAKFATESRTTVLELDSFEGNIYECIDKAIENSTSNNCFYVGPSGIAIGRREIKVGDAVLDQDGNAVGSDTITSYAYRFKVDRSGRLTTTDVTLSGNITATSGIFGGWKLIRVRIVPCFYEGNNKKGHSIIID